MKTYLLIVIFILTFSIIGSFGRLLYSLSEDEALLVLKNITSLLFKIIAFVLSLIVLSNL